MRKERTTTSSDRRGERKRLIPFCFMFNLSCLCPIHSQVQLLLYCLSCPGVQGGRGERQKACSVASGLTRGPVETVKYLK